MNSNNKYKNALEKYQQHYSNNTLLTELLDKIALLITYKFMEELAKKNVNPTCSNVNSNQCNWGHSSVDLIVKTVVKVQVQIYQLQRNLIDNPGSLDYFKILESIISTFNTKIVPTIKKLKTKLEEDNKLVVKKLPQSLVIEVEHNIKRYLELYLRMVYKNLSYNKVQTCNKIEKTEHEAKINRLRKAGILRGTIGVVNEIPEKVCVNIELGKKPGQSVNTSVGAGKRKKRKSTKGKKAKKAKKAKKVSKK